jgi:acyl dehydratase
MTMAFWPMNPRRVASGMFALSVSLAASPSNEYIGNLPHRRGNFPLMPAHGSTIDALMLAFGWSMP